MRDGACRISERRLLDHSQNDNSKWYSDVVLSIATYSLTYDILTEAVEILVK